LGRRQEKGEKIEGEEDGNGALISVFMPSKRGNKSSLITGCYRSKQELITSCFQNPCAWHTEE
jgi:hypothetical protein